MDFIREWITTLAGVIAIAAICDVIMIDGEMKKYIKPVLGFIMIIIVAQPLVSKTGKVVWEIPEVTAAVSMNFSSEIEDVEQENIKSVYQKKLARQVENEISKLSADFKDATAFVTVNNSGEITNITVNLTRTVVGSDLKEYISTIFGIDENSVSVICNKR